MNSVDVTGVLNSLAKVTDRLDLLERENRRLKWVAAVMFVGTVVAVAEGSTLIKKPKSPDVQQLVVRDAAGTARIMLGLNQSGDPELSMFNADGETLVRMEGQNGTSSSLMLAAKGNELVHLTSNPDGSAALRLSGVDQQSYAAMYLQGNGTSGVMLSHQVMGVQIGVQPEGISGIAVTDLDGVERGRLGNLPENISAAGLTHPNGKAPFRVVDPGDDPPATYRTPATTPTFSAGASHTTFRNKIHNLETANSSWSGTDSL